MHKTEVFIFWSLLWGNLHKSWRNYIFIGTEFMFIMERHTWGSTWISLNCPLFIYPHCFVAAFKPLACSAMIDLRLDSKAAYQTSIGSWLYGFHGSLITFMCYFIVKHLLCSRFLSFIIWNSAIGQSYPPKYE